LYYVCNFYYHSQLYNLVDKLNYMTLTKTHQFLENHKKYIYLLVAILVAFANFSFIYSVYNLDESQIRIFSNISSIFTVILMLVAFWVDRKSNIVLRLILFILLILVLLQIK
jgi:hypothetical protein